MIDFSVLIPVYNSRPEFLAEAVYSILHQKTKQPFNIIIANDGSTDVKTLAFLEYLQKVHGNIKVVSLDKNQGTPSVLNFGHSHVQTEYVALIGDDDYSHPDRFPKQLAYIKEHKPDVVGCNLFAYMEGDVRRKSIFTSRHPEIIEKPGHYPNNPWWITNHGTVFYRDAAVKSVGGYDTGYKRGQDINLWKRMFTAGFKFRNVTEVLHSYRRH